MSMNYCKRPKESVPDYVYRIAKSHTHEVFLNHDEGMILLEYLLTLKITYTELEYYELWTALEEKKPKEYFNKNRVYGAWVRVNR